MDLGTQLKTPDGREWTVVYNGLDGVGVVEGLHDPDPRDFEGSSGNLVAWEPPDDFQYIAQAILREPWCGCEKYGWKKEMCIGKKYEILRYGLTEREGR